MDPKYNPSKQETEPKKPESGNMYFKETALSHHLSDISPKLTQKEIRTSFNSLCTDEKGTSFVCQLKNDSGETRLLLDYKPTEKGKVRETALLNVSAIEGESLVNNFTFLRSRLNPKERGELISYLSKYQATSEDIEYPSIEVSSYVLGFFKDSPDLVGDVSIEGLEIPDIFNPKQRQEIENLIKTLLKKVPNSKHSEIISKLNNELYWSYNGLTEAKENLMPNFINIFRDAVRDQTYDYESEIEIPKFSIERQIKNTFQTPEEVENALNILPPLEEYPQDLRLSEEFLEYQIVNLSDVVGGFNMQGWEISTSTGRGLPNILKLTKMFKEAGYINTQNPISYIFYKGKYYAYGDGRHRTVALKIMGVEKIPAKVYVVGSEGNS